MDVVESKSGGRNVEIAHEEKTRGGWFGRGEKVEVAVLGRVVSLRNASQWQANVVKALSRAIESLDS